MPGTRSLARYWLLVPALAVVALLGLRALAHTSAVDALATAAAEPADPPSTRAYAGSIWIARGGPVIIGVHSPTSSARLTVAGQTLVGRGLVKERLILPRGALALRVALPADARMVWSPVGRRGDPEYVVASSLSPEPPERATFAHPGTAPLDGALALALLATIVATCLYVARGRLARVPRATWLAVAA
ncbi:MAG TPA: hypothetical protein VK427_23400, partial [Kofleriaceae bacterium]|nr:hypothetical protein [Kofleriaceae bacterium]